MYIEKALKTLSKGFSMITVSKTEYLLGACIVLFNLNRYKLNY